jgi:hypothetical protein
MRHQPEVWRIFTFRICRYISCRSSFPKGLGQLASIIAGVLEEVRTVALAERPIPNAREDALLRFASRA